MPHFKVYFLFVFKFGFITSFSSSKVAIWGVGLVGLVWLREKENNLSKQFLPVRILANITIVFLFIYETTLQRFIAPDTVLDSRHLNK